MVAGAGCVPAKSPGNLEGAPTAGERPEDTPGAREAPRLISRVANRRTVFTFAHRCPPGPYLARLVSHACLRAAENVAGSMACFFRGACPGSQTPQSKPSQGELAQMQCHALTTPSLPASRRGKRFALGLLSIWRNWEGFA